MCKRIFSVSGHNVFTGSCSYLVRHDPHTLRKHNRNSQTVLITYHVVFHEHHWIFFWLHRNQWAPLSSACCDNVSITVVPVGFQTIHWKLPSYPPYLTVPLQLECLWWILLCLLLGSAMPTRHHHYSRHRLSLAVSYSNFAKYNYYCWAPHPVQCQRSHRWPLQGIAATETMYSFHHWNCLVLYTLSGNGCECFSSVCVTLLEKNNTKVVLLAAYSFIEYFV